jgi:hypothetical protein
MPKSSRILLLPDKKFWAAYLPLCSAIKDPSKEQRKEVYDELGRLDGVLRPALDARWGKTDAYYAVSDDWNVCWHHSMSACSDQMCCGEFLDIVQRALGQMTHTWCFHASLECNEDMGWGLQHAGRGEIFFYRGEIFGNKKDKFDYALFDG